MGTINRFSTLQAPLTINPVSVEQFAMVPLAKAKAKAAGIQAASSMELDYDVDKKDLPYISKIANEVNGIKSDIVNRIMTEGVSDNLITEFVGLKKKYQSAKTDIQKAENTKLEIKQWENEVLKTHSDDPAYIDFIKNKEYEQGWQGTFNPDGTINQFNKTLAPVSFSVYNDADKALEGVDMTLISELSGGSYFSTKVKPDGTIGIMLNTTAPTKNYSNVEKLESKMQALMAEWLDPKSQRGAYRDYAGIDSEHILNIINKVKDSKIREDKEGGQKSQSYSGDVAPEIPADPEIPFEENMDINTTVDTEKVADPGKAYEGQGVIAANIETIMNVGALVKNLVVGTWDKITGKDKPLTEEEFRKQQKEPGFVKKAYDNFWVEEIKIAKRYGGNPAQIKKLEGEMGDAMWNEYITTNAKIEEYAKYGYQASLDPTDKKYQRDHKAWMNESVKKGYFKDDKLTEAGKQAYYEDIIKPYAKNSFKSIRRNTTINTRSATANNALKVGNDIPGQVADMLNRLVIGKAEGNVPILGLNNKEEYTGTEYKDIVKNLASGMENYDGKNKEKGAFKVMLNGTGVSDPELYKNAEGKFVNDLAFGHILTLYEHDGDNFVPVGEYVMGGGKRMTGISQYRLMENQLKKLGELGIGEVINSEYNTVGEDNKLRTAKSKVYRAPYSYIDDSDPNNPITVKKGEVVVEYDDVGIDKNLRPIILKRKKSLAMAEIFNVKLK